MPKKFSIQANITYYEDYYFLSFVRNIRGLQRKRVLSKRQNQYPRSSLTVSELLSKIESQTDYLFVYNKQNVDTKRTVTVDAENKAVSEIPMKRSKAQYPLCHGRTQHCSYQK